MYKKLALFLLMLVGLLILHCAPEPEEASSDKAQRAATTTAPTSAQTPAIPPTPTPVTETVPAPPSPPPAPDLPSPEMVSILQNARELREERTYLVTLESRKHQVTMSIWKLAMNRMVAVEHDVVVGESTYFNWEEGQDVSRQFDGVGFLASGEWSHYVTEVKTKQVLYDHYYVPRTGDPVPISDETYQEALSQIKAAGRPTLTVPYANVTSTYLLEKPLEEYAFITKTPLIRYYVKVRIQNSTMSFSVLKAARNATTAAEIAFEVPRATFDSKNEAWEPSLSTGSLLLKGRLSTLHGSIVDRWQAPDPRYQLATTAGGETLVIPTS